MNVDIFIEKTKQFLVSSAITFITGFIMGVTGYIQSTTNLNFESFFSYGFWVGIILAGLRYGVVILWDYVLPLIPKFVTWLKSFVV